MGKSLPFEDEFPLKENMEMFQKPSKRIRLDLASNFDRNVANDDLWGEDLTAEEFDMLEVQATQSHQQDDTSTVFVQPLPFNVANNVPMHQADETKQQLYELEGKIKLLTQSLDKVKKDLQEEKLKSNKLVNEKTQQSLAKENELRREIKKVESALQFKDQEMKSVYQKVHLLEIQLQEKKEKPETSTNPVANSFLEKFQFNSETSFRKPELSQQNIPKSSRKNKLLINTPRGEVQGTDIISTILCNRLSMYPEQNNSAIPQAHSSTESRMKQSSHLSAVSILRLSSDQQTEELFDYFLGVFKNYLASLKSAKSTLCSTTNSPSRRKLPNEDRKIVISCLKDLAFIISTSQFLSLLRRLRNGERNSNQIEVPGVPGMSTVHQFPSCDWKTDESEQKINLLLCSLVSLSSPESYPVNHIQNEEIELSLSCLLSWSGLAPESFLPLNNEIPYHSLFCYEDIKPLFLSLKFMTNLCVHKEFVPVLLHKNDSCLLCAMSSITVQKIPHNPVKYINIMLMIENFFSTLFTVYSFLDLKLDSSPCSSMVFQGVVISLCKFYEIYQEGSYEIMLVLRKGFTLVHQLSRCIPNAKKGRSSFEDSYISLVCGMLTLSKENPAFKEFYDLVHDLWDFQEDTSELYLDDPSEESSQMVEMMSQNGH